MIELDKTSVFGLIIGIFVLGVGIVLKGVPISALANSAAILIIILGTAAAVIIAFPSYEIKRVPKLLKILFTEQKKMNKVELINMFSDWAQTQGERGFLY